MRKSLLCALLSAGLACVFGASCATQDGAGAKAAPKDAKPAKSDTGAGGAVVSAEPLPNVYLRIHLKDGETVKTWDSMTNGCKPLRISDLYPSSYLPGYSVCADFSLELSKTASGFVLNYRMDLKTPVKSEPRQPVKTEQSQTQSQAPKETQHVAYQSTGPSGTVNVNLGEPMTLFNSGERTITITIADKPLPAK